MLKNQLLKALSEYDDDKEILLETLDLCQDYIIDKYQSLCTKDKIKDLFMIINHYIYKMN